MILTVETIPNSIFHIFSIVTAISGNFNRYQYPYHTEEKVPFIQGSALKALENGEQDSIIDVLKQLDKLELSQSETIEGDADTDLKEEDLPFLCPMQIIHNIKGVGIAVIGKAIQGILNTGDNVELIGGVALPTNKKQLAQNKVNIDANVASLKLFDHPIKCGKKRDYLGIALHGNNVNTKNIKRGMYVVKQSKLCMKYPELMVKGYWRFKCDIEFFESESGRLDGNGNTTKNDDYIGRTTPMSVGFQPIFHFITNDVTGKLEEIPMEKNGVIMPGESVQGLIVCLQQSAVIWKDLRFIVREAGRTIGAGVITEPLDINL